MRQEEKMRLRRLLRRGKNKKQRGDIMTGYIKTKHLLFPERKPAPNFKPASKPVSSIKDILGEIYSQKAG